MNTLKESRNFLEIECDKEKKIAKMKFCIISCYKSQMSKNRLLMFAFEK